jgi:hypothetical protein
MTKYMKNYYYNPKTQDLMIYDSTTNEMDVLEVLRGIRVITSSEIQNPVDDDGHRTRPRFSDNKVGPKPGTRRAQSTCSKCGKKGHRSNACPGGQSAEPAKKGGKWKCKNCGELGHSAKTCKNPPKESPPLFRRNSPMKRSLKSRGKNGKRLLQVSY